MSQQINDILEYKGQTFKYVIDETIPEYCKVCDFMPYCEDYIKENAWIACGAITPNNIYLKRYGRNN